MYKILITYTLELAAILLALFLRVQEVYSFITTMNFIKTGKP